MKITKMFLACVAAVLLCIPISITSAHPQVHRTARENEIAENLSARNEPSDFAKQMLILVNQERAKQNLPPLRLSDELMEAASIRAEEITQFFSHTRPNGKPCNSLIENGAYTMGENIAAGLATPEETVRQWMGSPGHRANILNADYTELGVGFAYRENSKYRYYWVQIFRRPMSRAIRHR